MPNSSRFDLNATDLNKWLKTTILFFAPTIIVYLMALQNGNDWNFALGSAYASLITSIIDLLKRWVAEN